MSFASSSAPDCVRVLPGREVVGGEVADHLGGQRVAEQVALREVAAERAQRLELRRRLEPFGDRGQLERVREADDRLDDARVLRLAAEAVDEAAVDLQRLDRESA